MKLRVVIFLLLFHQSLLHAQLYELTPSEVVIENGVLVEYKWPSGQEILISDKIGDFTSIGDGAFFLSDVDALPLKRVVITAKVDSIMDDAFYDNEI